MAKGLTIGMTSVVDDAVFATLTPTPRPDVTVPVPAGAEAIGSGFEMYNVTTGAAIGTTFFVNAPVSGGWRFHYFHVGGVNVGDTIRATYHVSYVQS